MIKVRIGFQKKLVKGDQLLHAPGYKRGMISSSYEVPVCKNDNRVVLIFHFLTFALETGKKH